MALSSFLENKEFLDLRRLNNPKDYYNKKGVPRRDSNGGPPVPKASALSVMLAGPGKKYGGQPMPGAGSQSFLMASLSRMGNVRVQYLNQWTKLESKFIVWGNTLHSASRAYL